MEGQAGDAHGVAPFGGEGVNAATLDAAELARVLGACVASADSTAWIRAVTAYETRMFERVVEPAAHSAEAAAVQLSHDCVAHALKHLRLHEADAMLDV